MEEAFAGVDWASEEHALCVVDSGGLVLEDEMHAHEEAGIREMIARMRALGVVRVAIERPDGLLVDRLLEAGFTVMPIHPNKLKATRPRCEASGGKSDGFDSFVLAELARTDSHRHRALTLDSDETKALRALTRTREDLVGAKVRLANELRAQLYAFWPGAVQIFADVDSPIGLAFLARYPSPADARGLEGKLLAGFLAPQQLLRPALGRRALGAAALGARGSRRRSRGRGATGGGARAGRGAYPDRRPDPRADLPDRPCGALPPRCGGLPAALQRSQVGDHGGAAGRRDRRQPLALSDLRGLRCRRRDGACGQGVGQAKGRRLSLPAGRRLLPCRLDKASPSLGSQCLPQRSLSRPRPSPCDPGSGPSLAGRALALLARRSPL
jgi:transposase